MFSERSLSKNASLARAHLIYLLVFEILRVDSGSFAHPSLHPEAARQAVSSVLTLQALGADRSPVPSLQQLISSTWYQSWWEKGKAEKNRKAKRTIKEQRMAEETKNSPLGSYKGNSFDRRLLLLSRVVCYATDDTNTGSSYLRCQFN